jgi:hypothetical protein
MFWEGLHTAKLRKIIIFALSNAVKMKVIRIVALCAVIFGVLPSHAQTSTRAEYIERYKDIAISHMEKYGIPASIKMAQGLLESNNGNSRLATEGNNHFGIKCKSDWTGLTIHHDDDAPDECFRRYPSAQDSWVDHSEYLDTQPRYGSLFSLDPMDYKAWAHGLKDCGYATNPRYAELLIKLIEDNRLYLLDRGEFPSVGIILVREDAEGASKNLSAGHIDIDNFTIAMHHIDGREIFRTPQGLFIVAREGDTAQTLAVLTGMRARRLARRNNIDTQTPLTTGQQIKL